MSGEVLLARPHPFLVKQMSALLGDAGFTPQRLESPAQLERLTPGAFAGAIISAAVSAESELSLQQAYRLLRARFPRLPLAFTALAGFEAVADRLRSELELGPEVAVVPANNPRLAGLGGRDTLVLLSEADVTGRAQTVTAVLKVHFRVR